MGADPIQATRNITAEEKRANDIRILVARGLIHDLVTQLARIMANRMVTGPEEVRLQDVLLREALNYAKAIQSGPASIEYMSPVEQAREVEAQSPGVSELKKMDAQRRATMDELADKLEQEVKETLFDQPDHEPIPFGLPKTKG
jgi:hypothetical protein